MTPRDGHRLSHMPLAVGEAANALARLLDCRGPKTPPRLLEVEVDRLSDVVFLRDEPAVAVFADLIGAVTGQIGLGLARGVIARLLLSLLGEDQKGELDHQALSALSEVGNIAISAAAGALGELAEGLVVPSVPRLETEIAEAVGPDTRSGARAPRSVYVVETEISDPGGSLRIPFIWLPGDRA